jgi:hypothetical protein
MKNILKYILIFVIGSLVLSSCEKDSAWDLLTKGYDKNGTVYYIQFQNASQYFETAIDEAGLPTNIVTTISVALLGPPQSSDVNVTLVYNASESTMTADMYSLSGTSITIPAGSTGGAVTLTAIADNMPEGEALDLVFDMDAGGAEASVGYKIEYSMKRIKFCPMGELSEFVHDNSGVTESNGYSSVAFTAMDGDKLTVTGLGVGWMEDWWAETVMEMEAVELIMNPNGTLEIERQHYMVTDYAGAPYRYDIEATGKWDNCEKFYTIDFKIYYEGEAKDLAATYAAYGVVPFSETFSYGK